MADWATKLGLSLGGDSEEAYQEGRYTGAKTEDALAQARERVEKNAALARAESDFVAAGLPRNVARAAATAQTAGGSFKDPLDALLKSQEYDFRAKAGDPNVPLDIGQRALLGVSSAPVEPLYKVGGGYGNKFNSAAGITPLGASGGVDGGTSAFIQSARAFGVLEPDGTIKPENRALAYEILRNTDKAFEVGGVPMVRSGNPFGAPGPAATPPHAPGAVAPVVAPTPPVTPLSDVSTVASNKGTIAAATEQGQAQGRNAASLPTALNTIDTFSKDIDNLLAAPGFDSIYGARVANPVIGGVVQFASQNAANADALRSKINAESFRASINTMRGLGQLSNAEGEKVQAALTILANPKIEPALARQAAQDLKIHLAELRRVAQIEAGQHTAPAPGATPAATPQGRVKMIGGRKFVETAPGQWAEDDGV